MPFKDVWSRSGSKYRVRAVVLLAINVLLFAGVGMFAFWIRSGVIAPSTDSYWDFLAASFRFGQQSSVSLGSLLLSPINVQEVGMQIWVLGLLMAALISIPILTSILYRFWSAIPFLAIIAFLAVMPWLAITLLTSCIIASVPPFRSKFRFMSALFGLVPAVIYLTLAWGGTTDVVAGVVDPVDRIKFIAPWVLAIVAAAVVFAIVLIIARFVDYRPGAVTPLLAVMFALPVGLFEYHVGRDELYYQLLSSLNQTYFTDIDASVPFQQAVEEAWQQHPLPRPSLDTIRARKSMEWHLGLISDIPFHTSLAKHQAELVDQCDWFLKYLPDSKYSINALYIRARALDMRVDSSSFRQSKWIRFYDDFPNEASRYSWRKVAENDKTSDMAFIASLRLAQLDARGGQVRRSIDRLNELLGRDSHEIRAMNPQIPGNPQSNQPETNTPDSRSLNITINTAILEATRLRDFLINNEDPIYDYDPICHNQARPGPLWYGLLDLEPRHEQYGQNLRSLKEAYPNCQIEDNIDLEIAKTTKQPQLKIEGLESCLRKFPRRDSAPEALYRLAAALREVGRVSESDARLASLATEYPNSIWAERASRFPGTRNQAHPVRSR